MANSMRQTNEEFWRAFFRPYRADSVNALLTGNDTQCFTTEQYRRTYIERNPVSARQAELLRIPFDQLFGIEQARKHLLSMPDLVREVRPDVWAAVDPLGA